MKNFYLIGLIGTMGSGKSTVRKMLEQLGAYSIDADSLAHVVVRRGTPTWSQVVGTFGADILKYNGRIDRRKLGTRAFANATSLQTLESIVHPAVRTLTQDLMRQNEKPVVVVEAIKLVEAGMVHWCDALWAVDCKPEIQISRIVQSRNLRKEDIRARLVAQGSFAEKLRRADVIIDNSGDRKSTFAQVDKAWKAINPTKARDKSKWLLGLPVADIVEPPTQVIETPPPAPAVVETPPPPVVEEFTPVPTREIEVRRSRRSDLEALGIAIAKKEKRAEPLTREEALRRFGERGYRIAVADKQIIALVAWEAENLVATVREIWAESADDAAQALPRLFELIENEARELLCEIDILLIEASAPDYFTALAQRSGYQPEQFEALHKLWKQALEERMQPGDSLWGKRLRDVITRPF